MRFVHTQMRRLGNLPFGINLSSDGFVSIIPLANAFQSIDEDNDHLVKGVFLQTKCSFWKGLDDDPRWFAYGEWFLLEDEPFVKEWLKTANVL